MSSVASLGQSASQVISRGFDSLDRAARKFASAAETAPSSEPTAGEIAEMSGEEDPLISGVFDLNKAKLEVGVGSALMRVYRQTQGTLLDLLG